MWNLVRLGSSTLDHSEETLTSSATTASTPSTSERPAAKSLTEALPWTGCPDERWLPMPTDVLIVNLYLEPAVVCESGGCVKT
jgi:hypothetical protein